MPISMEDLYRIVLERAQRAERELEAARMVIGPLSKADGLIDAVEDVCRQLTQRHVAIDTVRAPTDGFSQWKKDNGW